MRTYVRALLIAALAAALSLIGYTPPASAAPAVGGATAKYSSAGDTNWDGLYTGASVIRNASLSISNQPSTGCDIFHPLDANAIYQELDLQFDAVNGTYAEIGTAHQCHDSIVYLYWGVSLNGTFSLRGTAVQGTPTANHTYQLTVDSTGHTLFVYDGTVLDTVCCPGKGQFPEVGLESHASGATVATTDFGFLSYNLGFGWTGWDGQDEQSVTSPMCGRWINDVGWRAGENVTC